MYTTALSQTRNNSNSALQSRKWQLISMSQRYRSIFSCRRRSSSSSSGSCSRPDDDNAGFVLAPAARFSPPPLQQERGRRWCSRNNTGCNNTEAWPTILQRRQRFWPKSIGADRWSRRTSAYMRTSGTERRKRFPYAVCTLQSLLAFVHMFEASNKSTVCVNLLFCAWRF